MEDALTVRGSFLVDVFGFALLIDYRFDRTDPSARAMLGQPVPLPWLDAHPEVQAPLAREAARRQTDPDALFEAMIEQGPSRRSSACGAGDRHIATMTG